MSKKDRCFCGSGRASRNCHNIMPNSRAAELFNIFGQVNKITEEYQNANGHLPPCAVGCANCCSDYFTVSEVELEVIFNYIERNWNQEQIDKLIQTAAEHASKFQQSHPELAEILLGNVTDYSIEIESVQKYIKKRLSFPCLFLDRETNKCTVYEARPFICRIHGATHFRIEEPKFNGLNFSVCELIPSVRENMNKTPDVSELMELKDEVCNMSYKGDSFRLREYPLFHGVYLYRRAGGITKTATLNNRHNFDMRMDESNKAQVKKHLRK